MSAHDPLGECVHDWRINPFVTLTSNPPQRQLVCAKCRAVRASGTPAYVPPSNDPSTWEKWNG